jgi:hypothetical protein
MKVEMPMLPKLVEAWPLIINLSRTKKIDYVKIILLNLPIILPISSGGEAVS